MAAWFTEKGYPELAALLTALPEIVGPETLKTAEEGVARIRATRPMLPIPVAGPAIHAAVTFDTLREHIEGIELYEVCFHVVMASRMIHRDDRLVGEMLKDIEAALSSSP